MWISFLLCFYSLFCEYLLYLLFPYLERISTYPQVVKIFIHRVFRGYPLTVNGVNCLTFKDFAIGSLMGYAHIHRAYYYYY